MSEEVRRALPVASFVFGIAGSLAYVVQRLVEHARSAGTDPTLVVFTMHTSFYWRAMTASFWGGVFAIGAYAIAARKSDAAVETFMHWIARGILPFGLLLAFCSWWWP